MLSIKNIQKSYEKNVALKKINFSIPEGICFGLIGPNGAGKSTLMKILAGILDGYEGDILFFEEEMKKNPTKFKKMIGYVPQDIVLNETLSAQDNLEFFGAINGMKKADIKSKAEEILRLVGLSDRKKDTIKTFSGGMKRRINIGCALMHSPKFIIMDEPTVGVDPQSRNYIFDIIHQLKKDGMTILYSSHYMEEVELLCEEIALVDKGSVLERGNVQDILYKHSTPSIYVEAEGLKEETLKPFGNVSSNKGGYVIESKEALLTLDAISKLLQEKKLEVHRLEISKPNLEDIFLKLTGTSLRD